MKYKIELKHFLFHILFHSILEEKNEVWLEVQSMSFVELTHVDEYGPQLISGKIRECYA